MPRSYPKCIRPCVRGQPPFILYVANHHEECALLRDWNSSPVPVYFDLGTRRMERTSFGGAIPSAEMARVYLTRMSREDFLQIHREGLDVEEQFSEGVGMIVEELRRAAQRPQPLPGFQQYLARRRVVFSVARLTIVMPACGPSLHFAAPQRIERSGHDRLSRPLLKRRGGITEGCRSCRGCRVSVRAGVVADAVLDAADVVVAAAAEEV